MDRSQVAVGGTVRYKIIVRNRSSVTAQQVSITEQLASTAAVVRITGDSTSCRNKPFPTCQIGTLRAGERATVYVTVRPRTPGLFPNRVAVGSNGQESTVRDNTAKAYLRVTANPVFAG